MVLGILVQCGSAQFMFAKRFIEIQQMLEVYIPVFGIADLGVGRRLNRSGVKIG